MTEKHEPPTDPVTSQRDIKTWALDRTRAMEAHPCMWATTREAFGLQLALLLEVALGMTPVQATTYIFETQGNVVLLSGELDDVWGVGASVRARRMLLGLAATP